MFVVTTEMFLYEAKALPLPRNIFAILLIKNYVENLLG